MLCAARVATKTQQSKNPGVKPRFPFCRAGGIRTHDPLTPRPAKAVSGRLWASEEFRGFGESACAARGFGLWRTCADFGGFGARIVNGVRK